MIGTDIDLLITFRGIWSPYRVTRAVIKCQKHIYSACYETKTYKKRNTNHKRLETTTIISKPYKRRDNIHNGINEFQPRTITSIKTTYVSVFIILYVFPIWKTIQSVKHTG